MGFWEIHPDSDAYRVLKDLTADEEWWLDFRFKWGATIGDAWPEVHVKVLGGKKRHGDFPSFLGIPIFSERALKLLLPLIRDSIEVLPLMCETENLFAINVVRVMDCLDHDLSEFEKFSDGRIMRVENYVFKEHCLDGVHIFKIPEQLNNRQYVSDTFKTLVEESGLKGMLFDQIA